MNILEWLFWNLPQIDFLGKHINVLGILWFGAVFAYSVKQFRKDYPAITVISLCASLTLLVHFVLDETIVVVRWIMLGFDFHLFFNSKIIVYCMTLICIYMVYTYGRHKLFVNKKTLFFLSLVILAGVVATLVGAEHRQKEGLQRVIEFWQWYPTGKIIWFGFFLTLWKRKSKEVTALEKTRDKIGSGELYMEMALSRIKDKIKMMKWLETKGFTWNGVGDFEIFKASNKINIGRLFGIEEIEHGDFRDDFYTLAELEQIVKDKSYAIIEKGHFDNPPWFDIPARRKAFPIPIWLLKGLLAFESFNNRFTSHHVYVVGRKIS